MYDNNLIKEYERILKDPTKVSVDTYHFKNLSLDAQQNKAIEIIKYAIQYILHYTPAEAKMYFNIEQMNHLKLTGLLKYIKIPTGLEKEEQILYILSLCFNNIKFNQSKKIISIYQKVLKSKELKDKSYAWPKGFFTNFDAWNNATICLQYMIQRYLPNMSIEELYELFNDNKKAMNILTAHSLTKPIKKIYNGSTLDYLHNSLIPEERNEFLYNKCLFNNVFSKKYEEYSKSNKNKMPK